VNWFLNSVVDHPLGLDILMSSSLEMTINEEGHGLPYDALLKVMFYLFDADYIFAQRMSNFLSSKNIIKDPITGKRIPLREVGSEFKPTLTEVAAGLRAEKPIAYGLTAQGGSKWEEFFKPRWEHYLIVGYTYDMETSKNGAEIYSSNKALVEQYFDFAEKWQDVFIEGSEKWEELTPWEPTYWKTLPVGYQLTFGCKVSPLEVTRNYDLENWLSTIRNWYSKPDE